MFAIVKFVVTMDKTLRIEAILDRRIEKDEVGYRDFEMNWYFLINYLPGRILHQTIRK